MFESHFVFARTDQTQSTLQTANTAVDQAFNAVSAAEKAGANVTFPLNQLNNAADLLTQAENAYETGDSNIAANDASAVIPIAQQVTTEAKASKEVALNLARTGFWSIIIVAMIAAVVFVLALFLFWRWFERSYVNGLSEAKPEVATDEVK